MAFNKRMASFVGLFVTVALVIAFVGAPYINANFLMAVGSNIASPGSSENQFGRLAAGSLPGGARIPSGATILSSKGQVALGGGVLYSTPGSSIGVSFPAGTYDVYATFTDASGQVWYLIFNGFLIWVQG